MTGCEQWAIELLLSEPEIVAWLGAGPADDERGRMPEGEDLVALTTAGSAPRQAPA